MCQCIAPKPRCSLAAPGHFATTLLSGHSPGISHPPLLFQDGTESVVIYPIAHACMLTSTCALYLFRCHSLMQSPTHSVIHSLACPHTHTRSLTQSQTHSLAHSLNHSDTLGNVSCLWTASQFSLSVRVFSFERLFVLVSSEWVVAVNIENEKRRKKMCGYVQNSYNVLVFTYLFVKTNGLTVKLIENDIICDDKYRIMASSLPLLLYNDTFISPFSHLHYLLFN